MTAFSGKDGKRYKTTGQFRPAECTDRWLYARQWTRLPELETPYENSNSGTAPAIIVTPVEPTYEVTVTLDEFTFFCYRNATDPVPSVKPFVEAINAGNYREVEE